MTKYKVPKFLYVVLFLIVVTDLALTVWLILSKKKETTPSQTTGGETQTTGGETQDTEGTTQTTGGETQTTVGTTQDTVGESDFDKCTKYHTNCTKNPLEIDECKKYCKYENGTKRCRFSYHCVKEWLKQCQDCTGKCLISNPIKSGECTGNTFADEIALARMGPEKSTGADGGQKWINDIFCGILDKHGHLDKNYCAIDWNSDIDYTLCDNSSDCKNFEKGHTIYCCPPEKDADFLNCCSARSRTPKPSEPWCGLEDEGGCP